MENSLDNFYFNKDYIYELVHGFSPEIFNGGNKNRTLIMREISDELGIDEYQIAPYARVIELVHNATLIHDDVIDDSVSRRGVSTLNAKLENKKCILIGDYMLAKAMSELTSFANNKIVFELSRTLKDLVNGEILQGFENEKLMWSRDKYFEIANFKTGSVLRWCLLTPVLIKERDDFITKAKIEKVAKLLGMIYQMIDDIKDFSTLSKKTPFLDIKNWNINIVLINLQNKDTQFTELLRTNDNLGWLTTQQRLEIFKAVKETLFEIDQLLDEISKILEGELRFSKFASYIKTFINIEVLKLQKGMIDYDFEVNN